MKFGPLWVGATGGTDYSGILVEIETSLFKRERRGQK